jgi:hypothetical protein
MRVNKSALLLIPLAILLTAGTPRVFGKEVKIDFVKIDYDSGAPKVVMLTVADSAGTTYPTMLCKPIAPEADPFLFDAYRNKRTVMLYPHAKLKVDGKECLSRIVYVRK